MFYKGKKVVVTGGSGFIGSHYLNELVNREADVRTHTHIKPLQISDERIEVLKTYQSLGKIDPSWVNKIEYMTDDADDAVDPDFLTQMHDEKIKIFDVFPNIIFLEFKDINSGHLLTTIKAMIEDHEYKLTGSGGGIVIKGEGLYDEMKAFKKGKLVWLNVPLTVPNPNTNETNKKFIRVKASEVWTKTGPYLPAKVSN